MEASLDDSYVNRRVLIAGGTGFLGSHLGTTLASIGARVRTFGRTHPAAGATESMLGQAEFFQGDIRDADAVERAVRGCDVVFNLAGRSGSTTSNDIPLEDLDVNARGHLTLLEACRRHNPTARVVFASSRLVYRPTRVLPVRETAATGPLSVYGIHKLAVEHYHLLYMRLYGLPTVVLRLTNPYGPVRRPQHSQYGIINWFIQLALRGAPLPIYGDGAQLRDYIHVGDVSRAFLQAGARAEAAGRIFNVGSGQPIAFREMAELVIRHASGVGINWLAWPEGAARVETGSFVADISRIGNVLGWRPRVALAEGIADVVEALEPERVVTPVESGAAGALVSRR